MDFVNNNVKLNQNRNLLKNEWVPVVGGNRLDKPTFGEKFKYFFKRAFGFLGRLAGGLGSLFGPLGGLIGGTAYRLGQWSDRSADKQHAKKWQDMSVSEQVLQMNSPFQGAAPGFGDVQTMDMGQPSINNFNTDGLYQERAKTFGLRSEAAGQAIKEMDKSV